MVDSDAMDHEPSPARAGADHRATGLQRGTHREPRAGTLVHLALRAAEVVGGPQVVDALWRRAATMDQPTTSDEPTGGLGSSDLEQLTAVLAAAGEVLSRPDFAEQVGAEMLTLDAEQRIGDLLRCLDGPAEALALLCDITRSQVPHAEVTCEVQGPRYGVVAFRLLAPSRPNRDICRLVKGMLSAVPTVFGLAASEVQELQCQLAGASRCVYGIAWAPQSTPQPAATERLAERDPPGEATLASTPRRGSGAGGARTGGAHSAARRVRPEGAAAGIDGLLELASALASSSEAPSMAKLVARGAPRIGGWGQLVVLLWDAARGQLVEAARYPQRTPLVTAKRPAVSACGHLVAQLTRQAQPVPLTLRATAPVLGDLCRLAGFDDGVLMPVVAAGACYGVLVADVEPSSADLATLATSPDRLAGLADLLAGSLRRLALLERAKMGQARGARLS